MTAEKKVVGVVCEYNPFHNGHKHQLDGLRARGYDVIVCAMSGNFTQRGELAIADKYTRAEAAVRCGADVVLELPFPFSSLSAEGFAGAGVQLLAAAGCDTLSFGSESADLALLSKAADVVSSQEFISAYTESQKSTGSAKAYFDLLLSFLGEDVRLLPNDILGISYISAIKRGEIDMSVLPIKREGAAYFHTALDSASNPSATAVRQAVKIAPDGFFSLTDSYLPSQALEALKNAQSGGLAPVFNDRIGAEILSFFKLMSPDELHTRAIKKSGGGVGVAEDGCGLTERLCSCAKRAHDFNSFINSAYNARYPDARINRVLLFALLGASDIFVKALPSYSTLLAASENGRKHLSSIRKSATLPIITKPADAPDESLTDLIRLSDSLYASAMPGIANFDFFIKKHPYMG